MEGRVRPWTDRPRISQQLVTASQKFRRAPRCCAGLRVFPAHMSQDFADQPGLLNAGNDLHGSTHAAGAGMRRSGHPQPAATIRTGLYLDKVN